MNSKSSKNDSNYKVKNRLGAPGGPFLILFSVFYSENRLLRQNHQKTTVIITFFAIWALQGTDHFDFHGRIYLKVESVVFTSSYNFDFHGRIYLKVEKRVFT